jgi:hypothetical protein
MNPRFLKLTKFIINPKYIQYIALEPNKIIIKTSVYYNTGTLILGTGTLTASNAEFVVINDGVDDTYNKVLKWIDEL